MIITKLTLLLFSRQLERTQLEAAFFFFFFSATVFPALPVGQRNNNAHLGGAPGAPKCAKVRKLNMDYDLRLNSGGSRVKDSS